MKRIDQLPIETSPSNTSDFLIVDNETGTTKRLKQEQVSNDIKNIKDYGAVGNGIANDTAAIQAALLDVQANGKHPGYALYFPAGTYRITAPVYHEIRDTATILPLRMFGLSAESCTILFDGTQMNQNMLVIMNRETLTVSTSTHSKIEELTFINLPSAFESDMLQPWTSGAAIYIDSISNITINNCKFQYGKYGIYSDVRAGVTENDALTVTNCTFNGVHVGVASRSTKTTVNNCNITCTSNINNNYSLNFSTYGAGGATLTVSTTNNTLAVGTPIRVQNHTHTYFNGLFTIYGLGTPTSTVDLYIDIEKNNSSGGFGTIGTMYELNTGILCYKKQATITNNYIDSELCISISSGYNQVIGNDLQGSGVLIDGDGSVPNGYNNTVIGNTIRSGTHGITIGARSKENICIGNTYYSISSMDINDRLLYQPNDDKNVHHDSKNSAADIIGFSPLVTPPSATYHYLYSKGILNSGNTYFRELRLKDPDGTDICLGTSSSMSGSVNVPAGSPGSQSVTFTKPHPTAGGYKVFLTAKDSGTFWVSSQSTTGFTVSGNTAQLTTVNWFIVRD